MDGGYFWHYNELWIGGAGAPPGEKAWIIVCILVVFPMRIAAAIAFLQMKRWGHQWLIVTCWFGVIAWFGYILNMTMYATCAMPARPSQCSVGGRTTSSTSHRSSRSRICTR